MTGKDWMYDKGTMKVVFFACAFIVLAVVATGSISYFITQDAIVDKLKTKDMIYIIESIASQIDGRIERAKESSLLLATDSSVIQWVAGGETDERVGRYAKERITGLARNYDYSNAFIISALTKKYWAEDSRLIDVMSESDPDDSWFFAALKAGRPVALSIHSFKEGVDTFVSVNALIGDGNNPLGLVGVGLSLRDIAKEFQNYKIGEDSNLWLVDRNGEIHLSEDIEHVGMNMNELVPSDIAQRIVTDNAGPNLKPRVVEYVNKNGGTMDLVYQATKSTDWYLVFQMPRSESVAILNTIKINAMVAGFLSLIVIIFIFYFISHRIANPLKRALLLGQEMEKEVAERTKELAEKNHKIMDSIDYAQRLQEAILPACSELAAIFGDYFIIWKPRDQVGGDFFWVRKIDENRSLVAVLDCTGHGVPGAFMTMAVNSILDPIVAEINDNPARILEELNRKVKETLHRSDPSGMADDGLDIGLCYVENNRKLVFAGAKIPLYVIREGEIHLIPGVNKSIGYRRSKNDLQFTNMEWIVEKGDVFAMTSDGYIDQNGGSCNYSLGRENFIQALSLHISGHPLSQEREILESVLDNYRGAEAQRDDITVLGFSF